MGFDDYVYIHRDKFCVLNFVSYIQSINFLYYILLYIILLMSICISCKHHIIILLYYYVLLYNYVYLLSCIQN